MTDAIFVRSLSFRYGQKDLFANLSLAIPGAARCLLLGQNGVGKSTLLRILGGKHMVPPEVVQVLGRPAFHDPSLCNRVAFLGGAFPFDVDLGVWEILQRLAPPDDPGFAVRRSRAERLLTLLEIDPAWRMHQLSSGQRRRVQVLLGMLDPVEVVLLDEVTADLDVLSRADLLLFLKEESESRGTTVVYATHILDGLERWATHLCFLSPLGNHTEVRVLAPLAEVPELLALSGSKERGASPLLELTERWLREDRGNVPVRRDHLSFK